jgi:hypothetical protein
MSYAYIFKETNMLENPLKMSTFPSSKSSSSLEEDFFRHKIFSRDNSSSRERDRERGGERKREREREKERERERERKRNREREKEIERERERERERGSKKALEDTHGMNE